MRVRASSAAYEIFEPLPMIPPLYCCQDARPLEIKELRPELLQNAFGNRTLPLSGRASTDTTTAMVFGFHAARRSARTPGDHFVVFQIQRKDDEMHDILVLADP